jgi:hypothetical protein
MLSTPLHPISIPATTFVSCNRHQALLPNQGYGDLGAERRQGNISLLPCFG